jgi:three-Cys-motif partner protein
MATGDVVLSSDGELAIEVGPWAKDKLHYISDYCHIFNKGMKGQWSTRTYIDLFSGSGICVVEGTGEEIPGSPLVALECKIPFTNYFFNDVKPELIRSLRARTESCNFAKTEYFCRDCNAVVDDLLQRLPADSLDFCFIDPLNWEIRFDSIRKLTERRRMDLAITFHIGNIKRVANKPPRELVCFFPDPSWQAAYKQAVETHKSAWRALLDAYENGLRGIGYKEIKDYVLEKNRTNVPLYHLIFASKHPRGSDFWDKIAIRSDTGQIRM